MFQFKTILLCSITFVLHLILVSAQRITLDLAEGFDYVSVGNQKTIFYMLEDKRHAIVTEGIPMENLYYKVEKGILTIHWTKEGCKAKKSLVLLYPKGNEVPKIIHIPENGLVRL